MLRQKPTKSKRVKAETTIDAATRNYIMRYWEFVAATAWAGWQKHGRGVVVVELEELVNERGEITRVYYMTAGMDGDAELATDFMFCHAENLMRGGEWYPFVRDYDPNRDIVFAIEHEDVDLPTIHIVSCGDNLPSPQEAFRLLSSRGLFREKEAASWRY